MNAPPTLEQTTRHSSIAPRKRHAPKEEQYHLGASSPGYAKLHQLKELNAQAIVDVTQVVNHVRFGLSFQKMLLKLEWIDTTASSVLKAPSAALSFKMRRG